MQWMKSLFVWVILLGFMVLAFNLFEGNREHAVVRTPINTVIELADQGKLKEVKVKDNILTGICCVTPRAIPLGIMETL